MDIFQKIVYNPDCILVYDMEFYVIGMGVKKYLKELAKLANNNYKLDKEYKRIIFPRNKELLDKVTSFLDDKFQVQVQVLNEIHG